MIHMYIIIRVLFIHLHSYAYTYDVIACVHVNQFARGYANTKYYFVTDGKANVHIPRKATNAK